MSEQMTLAEIRVKFESEWVLLGDPQTTDAMQVTGGRVLWHSKDRDELYRKAHELRPKHSAVVFTGTVPEGTAVIL